MRANKLRLPVLVTVAAGLAYYSWGAGPPSQNGDVGAKADEAGTKRAAASRGSISITRIARPGQLSPDAKDLNPLARLKRDRLRDTVSRPLFSPSRRPPPPPPRVRLKAPAKPAPIRIVNRFELVGVIMGGPRPVALLRHTGNGHRFRVLEGERLGAWTVTHVRPRSVTLASKTATATLPLFGQ